MGKKVFLKLLPILALYFVVFFFCADDSLDFDQARYARYAENLTKGFYAPPETLYLWNGPGYPLLLMPFALFKIPWYWAKILNPMFLFLAVCFLYRTLRYYTSENKAIGFLYLFGLYPPMYWELRYLLTEPFVLALISAFAFFTTRWCKHDKYRDMFFSALICAYLILTKVFFAYVITGSLLIALIFLKWSRSFRKAAPIYGLALLFCAPYLNYTYGLTGRFFYWANSGGFLFYWITNPSHNQYGDWIDWERVRTDERFRDHKSVLDECTGLNYVERDDLLKKRAIQNIVRYPGKFALNWCLNVSRIVFNFGHSYKYQAPRQLFYLVPNALLFSTLFLCALPLAKFRSYLPPEIVNFICLSTIFLVGLSMIAANGRLMYPIVPLLLIVIAYTLTNLARLSVGHNARGNSDPIGRPSG